MTQIQDGVGSGVLMGVNKFNEGKIAAVVRNDFDQGTHEGFFFSVTTGVLALSAATAVLYMKTGVAHAHIAYITISSDDAGFSAEIIKNPTAGTLISAGSAAVFTNSRFDKSNTFAGSGTIGSNAQTLTDGTTIVSVSSSGAPIFLSNGVYIVLGSVNTLGFRITPQASGNFCVTVGFANGNFRHGL